MISPLSPEGIRHTWQPYYPDTLKDRDVLEIKTSMNRLLSFLTSWTSKQPPSTAIKSQKD